MAPAEITDLLDAWRSGDARAEGKLLRLLYPRLRRMAASALARRGYDLSLQPTELVDELYMRLARSRGISWTGRAHFFAIAARLLRDVLVDHQRRRSSQKRGAGTIRVCLAAQRRELAAEPAPDVLDLDQALRSLTAADPSAARVVELRYFGGLSIEEVALVLGVQRSTVVRRWRYARAWLLRQLSSP